MIPSGLLRHISAASATQYAMDNGSLVGAVNVDQVGEFFLDGCADLLFFRPRPENPSALFIDVTVAEDHVL
jgi:hypothetical protein